MLYGTLGSAAACASLLGLDEEGAANAIAIASSFSGGLNQTWIEGSTEWRWELGMAARNGLWAGLLAATGAVGARHWFEGDAGFARAFGGAVPAEEEWELGERWRILDVIYKPYPVCNITQSPVEAAIALVSDDDVEAGEVESIRCLLNPADRGYPGTLNWGPFEDVGASLMSAPFCVAMAVKDRDATLAGLHRTDDPVMRELVARTEVLADERAADPGGADRADDDERRALRPRARPRRRHLRLGLGRGPTPTRAGCSTEMAIDEAAFERSLRLDPRPDGARLGGAAGARLGAHERRRRRADLGPGRPRGGAGRGRGRGHGRDRRRRHRRPPDGAGPRAGPPPARAG